MERGKSCESATERRSGRLLSSTGGVRLLAHQRQKPADLTAVTLDHRGEFRALRHHHTDPLDDDVVDLEGAVVANQPPIDFNRWLAARAEDVARDDGPTLVGSGAADLERLTAEVGEAGAVDKDHVVLEQLQILLL